MPLTIRPVCEEVLKVASTLARQEGAKLLITHVTELELYPVGEPCGEDPKPNPGEWDRLKAVVPPYSDVEFEHCLLYGEPGSVEVTKPAVEILRLAQQENAESIVLGTHGRTGLSYLLMGSVAETVFCESTRPVIAVRLPNKSGADVKLDARSIEALNQLFVMHRFSLAMYLRESHEWTHPGDEPAVNALRKIANYHESTSKRIARLLDNAARQVPHSQFPSGFTAHNDIALDYLVPILIREEQLMLEQTQACLSNLGLQPALQGLIDSILKTEIGHVELLTAVERILSGTERSNS